MKYLHKITFVIIASVMVWACTNRVNKNLVKNKEEAVVIANDSLEYEIIIIDIGFNNYLNSIAQPMGYYSLQYLETKNNIFVTNWNILANNPTRNRLNFFPIDYDPNISYGLEVNYKLFNYFLFAQRKYRINLGTGSIDRMRIN